MVLQSLDVSVIIVKLELTRIFNIKIVHIVHSRMDKNINKNAADQLKKSKTFLENIENVLFLLSFFSFV